MKQLKFPVPVMGEMLNINVRVNENPTDQAIVYIPGHTDSSYSFGPIIDTFSAKESDRYTYLSFDIAWGDSDISRFPYTKNHQLSIIDSVLEHIVLKEFGSKIHLAGHSMGGELTLLKGLEEENKAIVDTAYESYIKTLTAIAPATYPRGRQYEAFDFLCHLPRAAIRAISLATSPRSVKQTVDNILKKHDTPLLSDEDGEKLYHAVERKDGFVRIFDVQREMHFRQGSEFINQYKRLTTPLQFIMGDSDVKISKRAIEYVSRDFPNHPLKVYENCSHFIQYQCPERIAQDVIRFADKYQ